MSRKRNKNRKIVPGVAHGALFALDTLNLELKRLYDRGALVAFGPKLSPLSGAALSSSVVAHRLTKAYEVPSQDCDPTIRKERSITAVLARDEVGFDMPGYTSLRDRKVFLRTRRFIRATAAFLKPTYQLVFPTGEGFTSSRGEKDLYYKLENMRYWECSPSSFQYVTEIFYRNVHMKRFVKKRFYMLQLQEFGFDRKTVARRMFERFEGNGFRTFRSMLSFLVRLVDVSRMTTVPKDNSKDRVITCEPFLTMICQLSYMQDMRSALRRATGLDLRVLQEWHKARIRDPNIATIDLRNASNQIWLPVVKALFSAAPAMLKTLLELRTGTTQYGDQYHHFNMFSPMGCGLTFDVMTWILTGITRAHDPSGSVFGDDIVCKASSAAQVKRSLEMFGLEVNDQKSFVSGSFRESCGAFADVTNNRFITCYDLRRPTTLSEAFSVCNKIRAILAQDLVLHLRIPLEKAWTTLLHFLPRDAFLEVSDSCLSITDKNVYVPFNSGYVHYRYKVEWQRLVQSTSDLLPFRKRVGGLVTHTLDTVRMLHMTDTVVHGSSPVEYKWTEVALMG